jgi:hypothetical protein
VWAQGNHKKIPWSTTCPRNRSNAISMASSTTTKRRWTKIEETVQIIVVENNVKRRKH